MIPQITASLAGPLQELEARILYKNTTVELDRTASAE